MVLVKIAVLRKPVSDLWMLKKVAVMPHWRCIGIARHQNDRPAEIGKYETLEIMELVRLHMDDSAARNVRSKFREQGDGDLGALRMLDVAEIVHHDIGCFPDRFGMHMVE